MLSKFDAVPLTLRLSGNAPLNGEELARKIDADRSAKTKLVHSQSLTGLIGEK